MLWDLTHSAVENVRIAWRKDLPAGTYSSLAPLMVSGLLRPKVELAGRCVGSDVC